MLKEFFGFGGYTRTPEGAYSWQHLLFVGLVTIIMIGLAIFLGLRNKNKDEKTKNKVLIWAAILIDGFEIFKLIIFATRAHDITTLRTSLPLFLCSIQLITIPLAAFSKGKIKEASMDFVVLFGILGGIAGTIGAAQNYNAYPVLAFDNIVSAITHNISAFTGLYIIISGLITLKKENIWIVCAILFTFIILALIANKVLDYNYMFLRNHDGTPYFIFYNMVNGNKILYPIVVVLAFLVYMAIFYLVFYLITNKKQKKVS